MEVAQNKERMGMKNAEDRVRKSGVKIGESCC
jgi:hypothetical protein